MRESCFLLLLLSPRSLKQIASKGNRLLLSDRSEGPFGREDRFPIRTKLIDDVRCESNRRVEEEVGGEREGESQEEGIQQLSNEGVVERSVEITKSVGSGLRVLLTSSSFGFAVW